MSDDKKLGAPKKVEEFRNWFGAIQEDVARALPSEIGVQRFMALALNTVRRSPTLLACDARSVLAGVMQAAQLGLELDGILGHAYLVPFGGKQGKQAVFIPGYRGLKQLAMRSGQIRSIHERGVYEGDEFFVEYGLDQRLVHRPGPQHGIGDPIAVYSIARFTNGATEFEVMSREETEVIRKRAPAGQKGPWVTDTAEMRKKTVCRRLCKRLPMSAEDLRAVMQADYTEAGGPGGQQAVQEAARTHWEEIRVPGLPEPEESAEEPQDELTSIAEELAEENGDAELLPRNEQGLIEELERMVDLTRTSYQKLTSMAMQRFSLPAKDLSDDEQKELAKTLAEQLEAK